MNFYATLPCCLPALYFFIECPMQLPFMVELKNVSETKNKNITNITFSLIGQ